MAIHFTRDTTHTTNVRYSAFLGMLYVFTPENELLINEAKALVGEAEVKKGYQGYKGDSSSAKSLGFLRDKGITPIKVSGTLTSARVIEREVDGRKTSYLNVGLRDDDGRYYLSVELGQSAAQMLARKLANADVGVDTEISLFATYGQREGASRAYADHGASLIQHGFQIKSIDPRESLVPKVNAALNALELAGVSKDDKETFAKRRAKVELEFHRELLEAVNEKFNDFYARMELPSDGDEESEHEGPASRSQERATPSERQAEGRDHTPTNGDVPSHSVPRDRTRVRSMSEA